MKTLFVVTTIVVASLAAVAFAIQGEAQDVEAGCRAACVASRAEVCEPAMEKVRDGTMTQERADGLCACGVAVCTNVCTCEANNETPCRRQVSAECDDLGVTMPE